jgi:hypothetical protein
MKLRQTLRARGILSQVFNSHLEIAQQKTCLAMQNENKMRENRKKNVKMRKIMQFPVGFF